MRILQVSLLFLFAHFLQLTEANANWGPILKSPIRRGSFHINPASRNHATLARKLVSRDDAADLHTVAERRKARVIGSIIDADQISAWLKTIDSNGKWPDNEINYATQCAAQRSNWPAQTHWTRIVTMSSAYSGIPGVDEYKHNSELQAAVSKAMDWWFDRDFNANPQCQGHGGEAVCPCDPAITPPQWLFNTNWFSNIILIPRLVGQACLLMNSTLTSTQFSNCTTITRRAYSNFWSPANSGSTTGANLLDVSNVGIDGGILGNNLTQVSDAYNRIHSAIVIVPQGDGIHADGSFGQHNGLLYNGNYGKDYANAVMAAEVASAGTQWAASSSAKSAFETLFTGNSWMIFRNTFTKVLHWDFSVMGRMIAFSTRDPGQSPSSILQNLTEVKTLGTLWDSDVLTAYADKLAPNTSNPNAGALTGIKSFWTNDYVVSRGKHYVSTLKMFSTRTRNTECLNSGNLKGFHLGDGTVYNYVDGAEYEDVVQAWDWNLIPGTTVDYGGTDLVCGNSANLGLSPVVGAATDGKVAAAAMTYINPITKALSWRKAWFFLEDDVQYVMVNNITSTNGKTIYTTLDQKKHTGNVEAFASGNDQAIWHNGVGYVVPKSPNFKLSYKTEKKQGNWTDLGTSVVNGTTVDMFTATIEHKKINAPLQYTIFPGADLKTFKSNCRRQIIPLDTNANVTVAYDQSHSTVFFVFWNAGNATLANPERPKEKFSISSSNAAVGFVKVKSGQLTVADPTQLAPSVTFTVGGKSKTISLPSGLEAGTSVTNNIYH